MAGFDAGSPSAQVAEGVPSGRVEGAVQLTLSKGMNGFAIVANGGCAAERLRELDKAYESLRGFSEQFRSYFDTTRQPYFKMSQTDPKDPDSESLGVDGAIKIEYNLASGVKHDAINRMMDAVTERTGIVEANSRKVAS